MNAQDLEDAIRELCDKSGLSSRELVDVLDPLKAGYEMAADEEEGNTP